MNTALLPYRLKSVRKKKSLQKEDYDKQLLRFERKFKALQNESSKVVMETLKQPYQKGWKRLFVLTQEAAKSKNAACYQNILDKINGVQYHYDKSFKRRNKGNRIYRGDYKELPKLSSIGEYNWTANKLNLTDEQRAYFRQVKYWNAQYYRWEVYYVFAQPALFEIKVLPHIIYEVKLGDALLAQEEDFLYDYLYSAKPAACRLAKIKGGGYNRWDVDYDKRPKNANSFKNRQVWDVWDEYNDEMT